MMPAINKRLSTTAPTRIQLPASERGLSAMAATQTSTKHCNTVTKGTLGRPTAIWFQKKLDRLPNMDAAEITAIIQGWASKALAAKTATKPPSSRPVARGMLNSVHCSRRKLLRTAGSRPGGEKKLFNKGMGFCSKAPHGPERVLSAARSGRASPIKGALRQCDRQSCGNARYAGGAQN